MKAPCPALLYTLALVLAATASAGAESVIVVNFGPYPSAEVAGSSEAKVNWSDADTADDTVCTECFAAGELQRYLRKMTRRREDFAVVDDDLAPGGELILVGGPASNAASRRLALALGVDPKGTAKLGPEGYRIKTATPNGRRVTLVAGGGRVGTLYGTYDLLHRLGCRWFAPGAVHEEVPRIDRLGKFDVTQRPAFLSRGFLAWEDRAGPDFLLWMARNRLNEWCVQQRNHPLMRKLGIRMVAGMHDAQWQSYDHPRFEADQQKPNDPYPAGGQYRGDANGDGRLSYFEAHPEWYGLIGKRRVPDIRKGGGTNYCTSNPAATAEFMKNFVRAVIDGPYCDAEVIRFWTLDGGQWCQCADCRALGIPTDRNLLLVHRLDREVKKARAAGRITRPITIRFLAYADVLKPPTRPLPPGFDYATCSATFFPIIRCYVHNFDDPGCARNAEYHGHLRGWAGDPQRHYRGQICLGEYYNVSGYKCLPICFMHTMAHDIPLFHKAGARHFHYMHVTTGNWGNKALTNYQMARQLWDVRTDCEALWEDYFAGRYGPAAATMRRFYLSLQKMLSNVSEIKYGLNRRMNAGAKELFPTPHLRYRRQPGIECNAPTLLEIVGHAETCRELIDQALAMELPERIRARVAEDERMFTYGQRTIAYYHACVQAFQLAHAGRLEEARGHYAEARRVADLLRRDTKSTTLSSSHANAPDAFVASYATGALDQLAKLLGPPGG
ncbi:MAG: DUF4838 domain-containing protein [Planctomycetota bacterium]|jgi:hypothetical protein